MSSPLSDYLNRDSLNRRAFLGKTAQQAAGVAAGMVLGDSLAHAAPNEKVSLAGIGLRNQGKSVCSSLAKLPDVEFVALCDVDESQFDPLSKEIEAAQGKKPRWEKDFRQILDDKSIQGVVIATPDHWHALMTIMACQAGKDVYVEKPISHNFLEGVQMIKAAEKHRRVVQVGIQQRSGAHFKTAIDYVRSGKLGTVKYAKAWTISQRKSIGHKANGPVPTGVDYEMWLGPAPHREFQANRFHYNWRWFWDYATGELGNWGVHMLDIARWGMNVELPHEISASGGKFYFNDDQETPDCLIVNYNFGEQGMISWEHRLWSNYGLDGRSSAAAFYGDDGTLVVDRGGWKVYGSKETPASESSDQAGAHYRNFIDCIKTRATPNADLRTGHLSTAMCHLGSAAYRAGQTLKFDPATLKMSAHQELLGREYRKAWELPVV
ncbi:MAG: Gfo/Idh/MocA family oxidoreductase [Planctomycetales bacterium]